MLAFAVGSFLLGLSLPSGPMAPWPSPRFTPPLAVAPVLTPFYSSPLRARPPIPSRRLPRRGRPPPRYVPSLGAARSHPPGRPHPPRHGSRRPSRRHRPAALPPSRPSCRARPPRAAAAPPKAPCHCYSLPTGLLTLSLTTRYLLSMAHLDNVHAEALVTQPPLPLRHVGDVLARRRCLTSLSR